MTNHIPKKDTLRYVAEYPLILNKKPSLQIIGRIYSSPNSEANSLEL